MEVLSIMTMNMWTYSISQHNGGAEWIDECLHVWVQNEPKAHRAPKPNACLKRQWACRHLDHKVRIKLLWGLSCWLTCNNLHFKVEYISNFQTIFWIIEHHEFVWQIKTRGFVCFRIQRSWTLNTVFQSNPACIGISSSFWWKTHCSLVRLAWYFMAFFYHLLWLCFPRMLVEFHQDFGVGCFDDSPWEMLNSCIQLGVTHLWPFIVNRCFIALISCDLIDTESNGSM
jgi:hypothetical protein